MTTQNKTDGGAAFPNSHPAVLASGMTLRDWFAGMALQGMLANSVTMSAIARLGNTSKSAALLAAGSYDAADEMLIAREKNLTGERREAS